jgi:fengycin family lipopeptide synthetase E
MKLSEFAQRRNEPDRQRLIALLQEFNRTEAPYPRDKTIPAVYAEQTSRAPDAVAVIYGEAQLSYRELDDRSSTLAKILAASGVGQERIVAILLDRSPAAITAMLGTLKAGGAYLPIDHEVPLERARYIVQDATAAVLVSELRHADKARALQAENPNLRLLFLDAPEHSEVQPECDLAQRCRPNSLAYVIYTSGTTGKPKGVMVEQQAVLRLVIGTNYIELGPRNRILQTGALSFDASTFEIWGALLNGGAVCLASRDGILDTRTLKQLVSRHGITTLFLTTALFNAFAAEDVDVFSGLENVLSGGEKVSAHHFNKVRKAHPRLCLKHVYGPTENTTFTTWHDVEREYERDIPIGRPIANTTVHILDTDLEPVALGLVGELCTGGDGLARGYVNDSELTARNFIPHPLAGGGRLYRTGDLACWLPDGSIEFLGRNDDQVKVRGFRVDPSEIIGRLLQHEAVQEAFVLPKRSGQELELVGYFTASRKVAADDLRAHLRIALPEYMVPSFLLQLDRFPLTATGKVDRDALPAPAAMSQRPAPAPAVDRPMMETEQLLLGIWREVLSRQDVGLDDDFFSLGGHSLKAMKLNALIHARIGLILPLTQVFEDPTIRQLAQCILDATQFGTEAIDRPMVLLNGQESGQPVFAFPPGTGDALGYGELADRLRPYAFYAFNFIEAETRFHDYADLIISVSQDGPYTLFGYSGGGNLAFHTAQELERRGKRAGDIIMLDSARFLHKFQFPDSEARRLASSLVGDAGTRRYVDSPVLRDKATRIIERYYAFFSSNEDAGSVDANIHVIASENSLDAYHDDAGRTICSQSAWREATRRVFVAWPGHGGHNYMLLPPHVEQNSALLRGILKDASAAQNVG